MSKGYGKTQRAILSHFRRDPDRALTTADMVWAVYGVHKATKSQRVTLIRACHVLEKEGQLSYERVQRSGSELIWFRKDSLRGEAIAQLKGRYWQPFSEEDILERMEAIPVEQRERTERLEREAGEEILAPGWARFTAMASGRRGLEYASSEVKDSRLGAHYTRRFLMDEHTAHIAEKQAQVEVLSKEIDELQKALARLEKVRGGVIVRGMATPSDQRSP